MGSQNNVNINEVNNVNNDVNICNSVSPNFNNAFDVSPSSIGRLSVDEKDIEAKPEEAHNRGPSRHGWISLEPESPNKAFTRRSPPVIQKKSFLPMRARDPSSLPPLQRLATNRRTAAERFLPSRLETSM